MTCFMKQLERIKFIYNLLVNENLSKQAIVQRLESKVTLRQIERDLKDLEKYYLQEDERLSVNKISKEYSYQIIQESNNKTQLQPSEFIAYDLVVNSGNTILFDKNVKVLELFEQYKKSIQNDCFNSVGFPISNIIDRTNFYELEKDEQFHKNIELLYKAISSEKKIFVSKIKYYATAENNTDLEINDLELIPVKIIYHRGDFYLCSFYKKTFRTDEVGQIIGIKILDGKFDRKTQVQKADLELKKRFGISKNTDNKIYDIELQFSESTGVFVEKFFWHSSQEFKYTNNRNVLMKLECGINRELVGWIFQWMKNVKINKPKELIDKYNEMLEGINKNRDKNQVLSTNIFNKEE